MGQLIPFGQKKDWNVNGAIAGLSFKTYLYGAANNTTPLASDFDSNAVSISAIAKIGGQDFTIYSGPLCIAAMESSFREAMFQYSNPKVFNNSIVTVAAAAGNPGECVIPMILDFGTILNCVDKDTLKISIQTDRLNLGASVNATPSYIEVDIIEGCGYGTFIPKLSIYTVTQGDQTFDYLLGDTIQGVTILDRNHASNLVATATNPWSQITFRSDKYNVQDDYTDLVLKRIAQFPQSAANTAMDRGYNFQLYALPVPLKDVRLQGTLVPANVANSSCVVVTRAQVSSPAMYNRAMRKRAQHLAENNRTSYGV